ncbi:MAG TPA: serine/threonine-protein kinase [Gemmataceae bacterium]|jgi:serine/threonine-protein kinase
MSDTPRSNGPASFSDTAIEDICVRFEDAWKAGGRPALEQYLGDPPADRRTAILGELLKLDLYYRRRQGERPTPDDYRPRFPADADLLRRIMTDSAPGESGASHNGGTGCPDPPPALSRYVPLRLHAEGGLGKVHLAHDVELSRKVAVKRIQDRLADDAESRRRFLAEAEITGRLEHPGVVPVYGLVRDADGQPCYAMRFIEGETLQEAIRRSHAADRPGSGLSLRQLLSRFVTVCNTIAYAHSRGIVHRDLKPANVMLGKYSETLVVDWGLAKPFDHDAAASAGGEATAVPAPPSTPSSAETPEGEGGGTRTGAAVGTPAYMSPEQARGDRDRIGPASDIFGLGAILFAVLTNRAPFEGLSRADALDRARRGEFPSPRSVRRGVPPALEAVCRKAMAVNPQDRYPTALALAADVEHWLADEPVTTYREPPAARGRRWVRKHPRLVTGVVATLAVGLAAVGVVAWHRERARAAVSSERDRAVAARKRTREALDAMVSGVTGDALSRQKELTPEQRKFLEAVVTYYVEFAAEPGEDREGRDRLARANFQLGKIYARLGEKEQGATALARAVELCGGLCDDFPAVSEYRSGLVRSRYNLATLLVGLGRGAEAEAALRPAIADSEKLAAEFPDVWQYREALASSHNALGFVLAGLGPAKQAEAALRTAVAIQAKLAADVPSMPELRENLARYHNGLGDLLADLSQWAEAAAAYRDALAVCEKLTVDFPLEPEYRREVAASHFNLGSVYARYGWLDKAELDKAEPAFRAGLAAFQKLVTDYPGIPNYRQDMANTQNSFGLLLARLGRMAEAEAALRSGLSVREKLTADFPTVPVYRRESAASHHNLGMLLAHQGRQAEAGTAIRASLAALEKLTNEFPRIPDYAIDLGNSYCSLGNVLAESGNARAALEWYTKAVTQLEPLVAAEPRREYAGHCLRNSLVGRARDLANLGQHADAVLVWDRVLTFNNGSAQGAVFRLSRADSLARAGRPADAVREAGELATAPGVAADTLYNCACIFALGAGTANNPDGDAQAARAVELLRLAVAKGFSDIPHLLKDDDLVPIRKRADYADLLWDLADLAVPEK